MQPQNASPVVTTSRSGESAEPGQGLSAADGAVAYDSAELQVQPGETAATRGGSGSVAHFQDNAELVVRDASGNIKQQETVR